MMGVSDQRDLALPNLMQDPSTPTGLIPIINLSGVIKGRQSGGAVPAASEVPALTGQILYVAATYPADGWAICDGSLLPVNRYWPLFNLLGTRFGGDGVTNFALPNLVGLSTTPKGLLPLICVNGTQPQAAPPGIDGWPQIDAYFAQVIYLAFDSPVEGWARCDGRLLPVDYNAVLFSLLGYRFGGDGKQSFALPNLMNAPTTPPGLVPVMALNGTYPT
ncbi:tail fiber protein [Niveispirillum sp. KHB5.9]|uniref:tail fiber protein n=1 Tax=Niveispirillum sp. KHB5.9 TaxID=3400269 RepID=UPI003A8C67FF